MNEPEYYSAREIAAKLPAEEWRRDVTAVAYRTMQNRLVVTVETNASMKGMGFAESEDINRSDAEFIKDLEPVFNHLSPHDELVLAQALLRRLIQWESGADLSPADRTTIKREQIATKLIEQILAEIPQVKQRAAPI